MKFVENTIVSHNKQELEVVASGMEAMGLSVETGYFDPDDESSVDVPKQLIGFHYVVLKKDVLTIGGLYENYHKGNLRFLYRK